ncbi:MAG TPA: hypothetical protein VLL07_03545 [Pontiella sp.]|nr:hypothetical protein [Pontiella sp.]
MKTMRYFLALAAVLIFSGCATTFRPWNLSEVKEGMDRNELEQLLGEPDYVFLKDGAEHLRYTYREDFSPSTMPIDVAQDRAIDHKRQTMQIERSLNVLEYDVILVDGKVIDYKEVNY